MKKQKMIWILILALCSLLLISALGSVQPSLIKIASTIKTPTVMPTQTPPERPVHFSMSDTNLKADYYYRSFLQMPIGLTWGPDKQLYVGDWTGRHIVRITPGGKLNELKLTPNIWQNDGPRTLAFAPDGTLYVNDHDNIYWVDNNQKANTLPGIKKDGVIGSIAFSPDGELYYSDRNPTGSVRHWNKNGTSEVIAEKIPNAEFMVFAPDGTLYISQSNMGKIVKVNVKTHEASLFFSLNITDPIFLTVDPDGDIWIRGLALLVQLSPEGKIKPYKVDGKEHVGDSNFYLLSTPGGITFDNEGGMWIGSYDSRILKFTPTKRGLKDPEFKSETVYPGLVISSMAVSSQGDIYATDSKRHEVILINKKGNLKSIGNYGCEGDAAIALDRNDNIYVGLPCGKIVTLDKKGNFSMYAPLITQEMMFGEDGALYAIVGEWGQSKTLMKITGINQYASLAESIDGSTLGFGWYDIAAWKKGLYIFVERNRNLFNADYQGVGKLINIQPAMGGNGPAPMTATYDGENIFVLPHGPYELFKIGVDGKAKLYASGLWGDPWAMAISPDGKWLYIAESGAIDQLEIK